MKPLVRMTQMVGRRRSKVMEQAREALVRSAKRLTPEQRLQAHLRHSQLIHRVYQAGIRHRRKMDRAKKA